MISDNHSLLLPYTVIGNIWKNFENITSIIEQEDQSTKELIESEKKIR